MKGQCFPWAGKYSLDHPDATICHAVVTSPCSSPPHRYVHAWIEHNNLCLDWQTMEAGHGGPRFCGIGYPIFIFHELYKPERIIRYTPQEAIRLMAEHNHWGPWTEDFDDVIAEQLDRQRIPSRRSA